MGNENPSKSGQQDQPRQGQGQQDKQNPQTDHEGKTGQQNQPRRPDDHANRDQGRPGQQGM